MSLRGNHESRKPPRYPVALEYEDEKYIYISSKYAVHELQHDIEMIGNRPFKIILK